VNRITFAAVLASLATVGTAGGSTPGADVRLTNDCHPDAGCGAGYVSVYTLATIFGGLTGVSASTRLVARLTITANAVAFARVCGFVMVSFLKL